MERTNLQTAPVGRPDEPVSRDRLATLTRAAELEVDEDELTFGSPEERRLWEELRAEFEDFVARMGPVWIADTW